MQKYLCVTLALIASVYSLANVKRRITERNCLTEGKTVGHFYSVTPCEDCRCEEGGQERCFKKMCGMPRCGFGYRLHYSREQCCPSCIRIPGPKQVCVENGVTYQDGQSFERRPCEHCVCSGRHGRAFCMQPRCAMPSCPNGYTEPEGVCCPSCL